jgi:hypothetical protein
MLGNSFGFLTRYNKKLRGGSQPILAQANDGHYYVVKFRNNPQGANVCFNEGAGSELFRALGLPVPSWKPLWVSDLFLDQNPECWMQTEHGPLRPESGLCFASRFLGREGVRLLEILPGASLTRIRNSESFLLVWLIDILAKHTDNRQAIFIEDDSRGLDAFFVDHGHLFGGPKGELRPQFQASRYLDSRVYEGVCSQYLLSCQEAAMCLDADRLWRRVQALPDTWKSASALEEFSQCLCRISIPSLVQSTLDTMCQAKQKDDGEELSKTNLGRRPPVSILCPRLPATQLGGLVDGRRAAHSAVA